MPSASHSIFVAESELTASTMNITSGEVFETLPAMADHRRTKRVESLLADLDRPRNVQFHVPHDFPRSLNREPPEAPGWRTKIRHGIFHKARDKASEVLVMPIAKHRT